MRYRIYSGGKAATHDDLKHLNLFPPELIHMRTVVEAVKSQAPDGCCLNDAVNLRQTCTEVYNQEIIPYHSNRIRKWIDKQNQSMAGDHKGASVATQQQDADPCGVHLRGTAGAKSQLPMRG